MALAEACGFSGPLELLVCPVGVSGAAELRRFDRPFVLIGRDPCNDLCLDAPGVSRRHAYLQVIAGHVYCMDLDSRTGLHRDGGQWPSGWLAPGQAVRVGPFEVRLVSPGQQPATQGPRQTPGWAPTETRLPDACGGWPGIVELSRDGQVEARGRLTRVMTLVGRSPACRLRLSSRDMAKYHCALLRTPDAVWAINLSLGAGIGVGGQRVPWARLADGDRLEVCAYTLRLRRAYDIMAADDSQVAMPVRPLAPRVMVMPHPPALPAAPPAPVALDAAVLSPVMQQMVLMQQQMFDQFHQAMMTMVQMFGSLHRDQMGLIRGELDRLQAVSQELQTLRAELVRQPLPAPSAAPAPSPTPTPGPPQQAPTPPPIRQPAANGTAAPKPPEPAPAPAAAGQGDPTIHVWLSQRIEALEQERQSRWQKVMSFVLGK
jgi:pSer/pThr/pTyr-binding forkhead associated (FHA) protein